MLNKCFSFWLSILLLLLVVDANVVLSLQSPYLWQICHYGCETPISSQDLTDEQWAPQQIQSKHIGITVATQRRHKYSTSISSHGILAMPPSKQFQSTCFARKLLEQYYGSKIWQLDWTDTVAPCSCVSFSHGNHKQTNGKHASLHFWQRQSKWEYQEYLFLCCCPIKSKSVKNGHTDRIAGDVLQLQHMHFTISFLILAFWRMTMFGQMIITLVALMVLLVTKTTESLNSEISCSSNTHMCVIADTASKHRRQQGHLLMLLIAWRAV